MKYLFNVEPMDVINLMVLLENAIAENEKKLNNPDLKCFKEFITQQNTSYKNFLKYLSNRSV